MPEQSIVIERCPLCGDGVLACPGSCVFRDSNRNPPVVLDPDSPAGRRALEILERHERLTAGDAPHV